MRERAGGQVTEVSTGEAGRGHNDWQEFGRVGSAASKRAVGWKTCKAQPLSEPASTPSLSIAGEMLRGGAGTISESSLAGISPAVAATSDAIFRSGNGGRVGLGRGTKQRESFQHF